MTKPEESSVVKKSSVFMREDKVCKKSIRFKAREEKAEVAGFSNLYVSKAVIPKGCKKIKVTVRFYSTE